jgi:hypothetical protein
MSVGVGGSGVAVGAGAQTTEDSMSRNAVMAKRIVNF